MNRFDSHLHNKFNRIGLPGFIALTFNILDLNLINNCQQDAIWKEFI